jgi:hypothetical protein
MIGLGKFATTVAAAVLVSGCATSVEKTAKIATDYNQAFADSRNEALLLNVLRAWADEPLQFSTMGTVTGSVRTTTAAEAALEGIFVGAANNFKPKVTLGGGPNPTVTILPLSNKEFVQGILRPVDSETIDFMLSQRWDRELVLPLVVGGVSCKDNSVRINRGSNPLSNWKFAIQAALADDFSLEAADGSEIVLALTPEQVTELLKEGVGEGRSVSRLMTHQQWLDYAAKTPQGRPADAATHSDKLFAVIDKKQAKSIAGLPLDSLCGTADTPVMKEAAFLRSIDSMIHFLAEIHRINIADEILKCETGSTLSPVPPRPEEDLRRDAAAEIEKRAGLNADAARAALAAAEAELLEAGAMSGQSAPSRAAAEARLGRAKRAQQEAMENNALALKQQRAATALHAFFSGRITEEGLSEAQRDMVQNLVAPRDLFRVKLSCGEIEPKGTFVWTRFRGRTFYIPSKGQTLPSDRTLEVMAFLSDLIALQTSESLIKSTAPLISVGQ